MPDDPRSRNKVPQGEIITPTYIESHEDSTFKDCKEDLYMINVEEEYSTALSDDEAIRGDRPSLTCVVADQSNQMHHKVEYYKNLSTRGRKDLQNKLSLPPTVSHD